MKLNMVRDAKTKEGFYRFTGQKRQAKKNVLPLTNEKGVLVTTNMEKAEVLVSSLLQTSLAARVLIFLTSLNLLAGTEGTNFPLL